MYVQQLSRASLQILMLQGGPMTDVEAAEFAASPPADDALRLRLWDDEAKRPGLEAGLAACLPCLKRALRRAADTCPSA